MSARAPRTIADVRNHPDVRDYWREGNGHWATLRPGLYCTHSGAHMCHEPTVAMLCRAIMDAAPCDCGEPECAT